jgi:hypothetical protein
MTDSQRSALVGMATAVLACGCAPADIRFRAENLQSCLAADALSRRFGHFFGL